MLGTQQWVHIVLCPQLKGANRQDSLTNPASANNTRRPAAVEKLKQMHSTLSQELAELTKNIQRVEKEISSLTKEIQASGGARHSESFFLDSL